MNVTLIHTKQDQTKIKHLQLLIMFLAPILKFDTTLYHMLYYSCEICQWSIQWNLSSGIPKYPRESVLTWQVSLHHRFLNMGKIDQCSEKTSSIQRTLSRVNVPWKQVLFTASSPPNIIACWQCHFFT